MIARVAFRPEAGAELTEAVDWYETRSRGLGGDFLRALDAALAFVQRNPEAYPIIFGKARRALLRRYPYSLIYVIGDTADEILVVACFHGARDPKHWQGRL